MEDPGHPLAAVITEAAHGRFPAVDGKWSRVPPWRPGLEAVVSFTGHSVLAVDPATSDALLDRLGADGYGGANDPRLITALAGPGGWIGCLDVLLAGRGTGGPSALTSRPDLAGHPRVRAAAAIRDDVRVAGYPDPARSAVLLLSRGIAGLTELSLELEPGHQGGAAGTRLARDALALLPDGQLVLAAVAPGNARSLRALLAVGFVPLGSTQIFRRAGS